MIYCVTSHFTDSRNVIFDWFVDVFLHLHNVRRCNAIFSHQKLQNNVNAYITVKVIRGISFRAMAANWKHLKDTLSSQGFF